MLAALLIASSGKPSAFGTTEPTFTLSASANQLQYMMPAGTAFNGSVSTTGAVRVWVNAPNGYKIVDLGIVDKTASFNFVASQNGTYTVNFENDMSNSIQVTFSYANNPAIQAINGSSEINETYIAITIVIVVIIALLLLIFISKHSITYPKKDV